jgi:hypothetical protein
MTEQKETQGQPTAEPLDRMVQRAGARSLLSPPTPLDRPRSKRDGCLRKLLIKHTALPIVLAVSLGLLAVVALVVGYDVYSKECASILCNMVERNPPWIFLTGVAAAPSALLTWYWRTEHKKADVETAREVQLTGRFASAVDLLEAGNIGAIYALERIAKDSPRDHWAVMETLAAYVRRNTGSNAKGELHLVSNLTEHFQAIITILGRRDTGRDLPGARINLSRCALDGLDFTGGDFSGAVFRRSSLRLAYLREARFTGADFANVDATGASYDPKTIRMDERADMELRSAGAIRRNYA